MFTGNQVIEEFEKLSPEEKQVVIDYVTLYDVFVFQEDTDENLQEDIEDARNIKKEEIREKVKPTSFEELLQYTQYRLNKESAVS